MINVLLNSIPNPSPKAPPGLGGGVAEIMNWVMWGCIAVGVIALMIAWAHFGASKNKGEGNESGVWVGRVLIGVIGVMAAGALISGVIAASGASA